MKNNLHIITAESIGSIINSYTKDLYEIIKNSYILHEKKEDIVAPSSFLFFPNRPEARIIGLSAAISPNKENFSEISGIKWIASYPKNKLKNLPRASAIIILNDPETGFPMVCMEGSLISATRTSLSAAIAAEYLYNKDKICKSLGVVGTGFIAKHFIRHLSLLNWNIEEIHLYDTMPSSRESLHNYIQSLGNFKIITHDSPSTLIESSNLILFTTTENKPYIDNSALFKHNPCMLHISLRDISPDIILNSYNVVDDINHILAANTSVHLAYEKNKKNSSFINATIGEIIQGKIFIPKDKTIVFSPMGLGILDITTSQFIYDKAKEKSLCSNIEQFFPI